ncbi:putative Cell division cycle protein 16 like protein [Blattamonas nauphoetae]|uniref:Cell division cycle protein 16 like protein n=1 Tax=Blattamonas nauphoetae TaxID=2049346 RepID=A0ABQ9XRW3_9EUKA|nr:putative Cell division cycle protein 16 like protein [Blattamonas nauphoetae]
MSYQEMEEDPRLKEAESLYETERFTECESLLNELLVQYPLNSNYLSLLISTLFSMPKKNSLDLLSTRLAIELPNSPTFLYCTGCALLLVGLFDSARSFFQDCVDAHPQFAPSFVCLGHTYSGKDSPKAIASYRAAATIYPQSIVPLICVAHEYLLSGANTLLAERVFMDAFLRDENDIWVLNGLGVVSQKKKETEKAEQYFRKAISCSETHPRNPQHSTLYINLGHVLRKQRQLAKAQEAFEEAQNLSPNDTDVLGCLGFVHHLQGNLREALVFYHRAVLHGGDGNKFIEHAMDLLAAQVVGGMQ